MEHIYIIGVKNMYYSINIVFDETDNKYHVYVHDKNVIKWQGYDTIEEIEKRLDRFKERGIIDTYFKLN